MKPILFNTDMVKAILAGQKTVTRRVVKPHFRPGETSWQVISELHSGKYVRIEYLDEWEDVTRYMSDPYRPGDILYVRETWRKDVGRYMYKANYAETEKFYRNGKEVEIKWRPSIHMPKEAARIFLRVTDVRAERLQEITSNACACEGVPLYSGPIGGREEYYRKAFAGLWDSTIKPADLDTYGWEANPWVWVIEFERYDRPKE